MAREIRFGVRISGDAREVRQSLRNTQQDVRRYRREMRDTQSQSRNTTAATNTWASSLRQLRNVIGPLAGVGGVSMIARMTQQAISNTAAIQDAADTAGIGAEQYQELVKGFQDLGNISDSVTEGALRRFNRRFGQARQGTGQAQDALERLNVSLNQGTGPALEQAVRRLAEVEDSSERAALSSDLFGETAGPQLAGALGQGIEALQEVIENLRETNRIMSQDSIDAASELDQRWRQFTDSMRTNWQTFVLETIRLSEELKDTLDDIPGLGLSPFMLGDRLGEIRDLFSRDETTQAIDQSRRAIEEMERALEAGEAPPWVEERLEQEREILRQLERRMEIERDLAEGTHVPSAPQRQGRPGLPESEFSGGRTETTEVDLTGDQARERERRQNELLRERDRLLQQIQTPQEAYAEQINRIQRLHAAGEITQEQFNRGVEHAEESLRRATDQTEELNRVGEELGWTFSSAFEDAILDMERFSDVAQAALRDIARVLLRTQLTQPAGEALGEWTGSLFPSANGNAFDQSGVVPFARGGVVNRPTIFPFANGTGLMGEAGPEAIMPLRRGANGRLGVESSGSQTGDLSVRIENYGNDEVTANRETNERGLEELVITVAARDIQSGGKLGRAVNRVTGTTRRGAQR